MCANVMTACSNAAVFCNNNPVCDKGIQVSFYHATPC